MNYSLLLSLGALCAVLAIFGGLGVFWANKERREILDRIHSNPIHVHPLLATSCDHEALTCMLDGKLGAFEQHWGHKSQEKDFAVVRFCVKCRLLYWNPPE